MNGKPLEIASLNSDDAAAMLSGWQEQTDFPVNHSDISQECASMRSCMGKRTECLPPSVLRCSISIGLKGCG